MEKNNDLVYCPDCKEHRDISYFYFKDGKRRMDIKVCKLCYSKSRRRQALKSFFTKTEIGKSKKDKWTEDEKEDLFLNRTHKKHLCPCCERELRPSDFKGTYYVICKECLQKEELKSLVKGSGTSKVAVVKTTKKKNRSRKKKKEMLQITNSIQEVLNKQEEIEINTDSTSNLKSWIDASLPALIHNIIESVNLTLSDKDLTDKQIAKAKNEINAYIQKHLIIK